MEIFNGLIFTSGDTGNTALVDSTGLQVIEPGEPGLQRFVQVTEQAVILSRPGFQGTTIENDLITLHDETVDKRSLLQSGKIESGGVFKSDKPSETGAGEWKFGKVVHGTIEASVTDYVEVSIDGQLVRLIIAPIS